MERRNSLDPVTEIGRGLSTGVEVLTPIFSRLYSQEAITLLKEQMALTATQKILTIYRRLKFT